LTVETAPSYSEGAVNAPAIKPTTTQRVRSFLAQHGTPIRPWASLGETYAQLYALLRQRKNDPTFWEPLAQLLQEVIDSAVDPQRPNKLAAPQAELLASWDVDELVQALREALPPDDPADDLKPDAPGAALSQFTGQLSVAMLGCFLLLGFVAAGCSDDDGSAGTGGAGGVGGDTATTTTSSSTTTSTSSSSSSSSSGTFDAGPDDPPFDGPWDQDCNLDGTSILYATIEQSSLADQYKNDLCLCFEGLSTSWSEGLSDLFATGTPEEIAAALTEVRECCDGLWRAPQDYETVEEYLLSGELCSHPIYKGVSFPS